MTLTEALDMAMIGGPIEDWADILVVRCAGKGADYCAYHMVRPYDKHIFKFGMTGKANAQQIRDFIAQDNHHMWRPYRDEGHNDWRVLTVEELIRWTREQLGDTQ